MKLHQKICLILIALLPIQTSFHFWPPWSLVLGLRIDYLSPTIYLTDLILFLVLLIWFLELIRSRTKLPKFSKMSILLILLFVIANVYFSLNPWVNLLKWFKVVELLIFGFYLYKNIKLQNILLPLGFSVIFTSMIAFVQFIKQSSVGPIWWIGERPLSIAQSGIAKTILNGQLVMRPYATFPHPNAMAGFLLIVLTLIILSKNNIYNSLKVLIIFLGTIAIIISFSRSVWLVGLLLLMILLFRNYHSRINFSKYESPPTSRSRYLLFLANASFMAYIHELTLVVLRSKNKYFLIMGCVLILLLSLWLFKLPLANNESWTERLFLAQIGWKLFLSSPLIGIGLNNFVVTLPNFWQGGQVFLLQPIHNIFLLTLVETGILGLFCLIIFLFFVLRQLYFSAIMRKSPNSYILLVSIIFICLLGMTDHYWFTLQQNLLLFTLVISFSLQDLSKIR